MSTQPEKVTNIKGRFYQRRISLFIVIGVLITIYLIGAYSGVLRGNFLSYWSDFFWTFAALAAGWRCLITASKCRIQKERKAWAMFGLAALSWFVGMLIWDYYEVLGGEIVPFPSIGDWFYMGYAIFFAVGLLNYMAQKQSRDHKIIRVANFSLITCTVMVLCYVLLAHQLQQAEHSVEYELYALLHSQLTVLIFVFGVYCYLFFVWHKNRSCFQLLLAALFVMAVTDTLYALQLLGLSYDATSYLNIYWLLSFALQYWSAFEQDIVTQQPELEHIDKVDISSEKFEATMPAISLASVALLSLYYSDILDGNIIIVISVTGVVFAFFLSLREWYTNNLESNLRNELLRTNRQLAVAQQMAKLGYWEQDLVTDKLDWSTEMHHIFGSTNSARTLSPDTFFDFAHPEDRNFLRDTFQSALITNTPFEVKHRIIRSDGAERVLHSRADILRGNNGQPLRLLGITQDITRLIESEKLLKESEVRFRDVAMSMGDWIWEVNLDGIYVFSSEKSIDVIGYSQDEIIGKTCFDFVTPEHQITSKHFFAKIIEEKSSFRNYENWNLKKNGERVCVLCSGTPMYSDDGKLSGFRGICSDITDQRNHQAQAIRASQLASLGELAAGVAHEINNPIGGVINYAVILKNRSENENDKDILSRIVKEGERIADIVRKLLSFSRDDGHKTRLHDIREVISEPLDLLGAQLRNDNIEVVISIDANLDNVRCNAHQIHQVLLNLITNCRHALNEKHGKGGDKKITLTVKPTERKNTSFISIELIDNGKGIPADVLPNIFNPFYTTKREGVGTGLGLSISGDIVSSHGGSIEIDSLYGEHTKVTITLPIDSQ